MKLTEFQCIECGTTGSRTLTEEEILIIGRSLHQWAKEELKLQKERKREFICLQQ